MEWHKNRAVVDLSACCESGVGVGGCLSGQLSLCPKGDYFRAIRRARQMTAEAEVVIGAKRCLRGSLRKTPYSHRKGRGREHEDFIMRGMPMEIVDTSVR